MHVILNLFKADLGIQSNKKDEYFKGLLQAAEMELNSKGVRLNLELTEDIMLLTDYAAWIYRKRQEDIPVAQNLQWRIRNRIVKGRANHAPE